MRKTQTRFVGAVAALLAAGLAGFSLRSSPSIADRGRGAQSRGRRQDAGDPPDDPHRPPRARPPRRGRPAASSGIARSRRQRRRRIPASPVHTRASGSHGVGVAAPATVARLEPLRHHPHERVAFGRIARGRLRPLKRTGYDAHERVALRSGRLRAAQGPPAEPRHDAHQLAWFGVVQRERARRRPAQAAATAEKAAMAAAPWRD